MSNHNPNTTTNTNPQTLTKNEALLEALRLLLDNNLIEVRGITVYFRPKNGDSCKKDLEVKFPDDITK